MVEEADSVISRSRERHVMNLLGVLMRMKPAMFEPFAGIVEKGHAYWEQRKVTVDESDTSWINQEHVDLAIDGATIVQQWMSATKLESQAVQLVLWGSVDRWMKVGEIDLITPAANVRMPVSEPPKFDFTKSQRTHQREVKEYLVRLEKEFEAQGFATAKSVPDRPVIDYALLLAFQTFGLGYSEISESLRVSIDPTEVRTAVHKVAGLTGIRLRKVRRGPTGASG